MAAGILGRIHVLWRGWRCLRGHAREPRVAPLVIECQPAGSRADATGSRPHGDLQRELHAACPDPSCVTAPTPPALVPICRAKCDRLRDRCAPAQVDSCRLNCTKYEPAPAGCVEQVRVALECARDARDLTCAHVAPESCAAQFRAATACSNGESLPNPQLTGAPSALPEGWERVSDRAHGFSLSMPRASIEKESADGPLRSVTVADGTTYSVSVRPALSEKPSEKSLLHFLMKVQGRCSDKLKLDGFIEKAGRSSIHYTSRCPDNTDWDGMIYVDQRRLVLLSARAPSGKLGITEPFSTSSSTSSREARAGSAKNERAMLGPLLVLDLIIPEAELRWTAVRASGPGGQNVNKVSSKVDLRFDFEQSAALSDALKERLRTRAAARLDATGRIRIISQLTRNQAENVQDARLKLAELLAAAHVVPKRRRKTKPSRAKKAARVAQKREHSVKKQSRGRVRSE